MTATVEDRFIALSPQQTRCPEAIAALAPKARKIYVLTQRIDCGEWKYVKDCFLAVEGVQIVTQPAAGRKYFTLKPKTVIARLQKAGVWP